MEEKKKEKGGNRVCCPYGRWDIYGNWYPNRLIEMSELEQDRRNRRNGFIWPNVKR